MASLTELQAQAYQRYQAGDRAQAERLCWDMLRVQPLHAEALYLLGVLALDAGQPVPAILYFHHATTLQPQNAVYQNALGEAYRAWGGLAEAVASFEQAIKRDPGCVPAHHALGLTLLDQGKLTAAVASFCEALRLRPEHERAHLNLGRALQMQGELDSAAGCYTEAIRLRPNYAIAYNNLGAVRTAQNRFTEAIAALQEAVRLQPDYPEAHFNLGNALRSQGDPSAIGSFQTAVRLRPNYVKAHCSLGLALAGRGQVEEGINELHTALRLQPDCVEAYENLGNILLQRARWEDALPVFEKLLSLKPDHPEAFACRFRIKELLCDWRTRQADQERLERELAERLAGERVAAVTPFNTLTLPWPPSQQLAVARRYSEVMARNLDELRRSLNLTWPPPSSPYKGGHGGGRLRIGYLGATFHDHATLHLMQTVFGLHDRQEFEVFAYSHGPDDQSARRRQFIQDCDHFRDIVALSTADSARQIHADGIHILVDLMGYTGHARTEILALRPAPIQVNWLAYPSTMAAPFIDYLIGDHIITPPERAEDFGERVVLMPHCYLATDHQQEIAARPVRRSEFQLPEQAFVFSSFNNTYKIEPRIFSIWMKILAQVQHSVLWQLSGGATFERNLRREAAARGIAPERLIFAGALPKAEHLARLRLADLFIDTYYINGHTTTVDALWAGVPVLTCPGETWTSRVASSLLTSIGLPELITRDLEEYERQAVFLARHPGELRQLREKLAANRTTWPLFDTPRFVRNLERAYREMWAVYASGQPPRLLEIREPA
jgi:predicted O-linked N-acetylglucosamine transferase (SPINDLY family)